MISAPVQQKINGLLRKDGHRLTAQKQTVLRVLFEHDHGPLTVEEIYRYAQSRSSHISIATVYKVVAYLEQANILHKIRMDDKRNCYELIHPDEPQGHPHCVCTKCGKTVGIVDDSVTHILATCEQAIETRYHFQINLQNILYYGICEDCRSKS